MSRRVFARDSHRTVDLSAQLAAEMLKRRGQGRNIWRPTLGFVDQGGDEAVPGCFQMRTPYATAGCWSSMAHTGPRRAPHSPAPAAPVGAKTAASNGAL